MRISSSTEKTTLHRTSTATRARDSWKWSTVESRYVPVESRIDTTMTAKKTKALRDDLGRSRILYTAIRVDAAPNWCASQCWRGETLAAASKPPWKPLLRRLRTGLCSSGL